MLVTQQVTRFKNDSAPKSQNVESLKELLAIPWVKRFEADHHDAPFFRWSKTEVCHIAEYGLDKMIKWMVIAHLSAPDKIDLPQWACPTGLRPSIRFK